MQDNIKRSIDILGAVVLAIIAGPVLFFSVILIFLVIGRPILYRQERAGHRGRSFFLYKLRTMTDQRDTSGALLPDSMRLTRLGRLLRRFSVDELPQLWNVLIGDMSLVGPRPLLASYLSRYSPFQHQRHNVRPGITGWAQISGRNALTWDEKFELDVWYVNNRSLLLDFRIAVRTLWIVLFGNDGLNGDSPPEFKQTLVHSQSDCSR